MSGKIKFSSCLVVIFSSAFLAFGLYNVHSLSGVTEGGILGLTLLLDHWFNISPAFSGFIFNVLCYAIAWKLMGKAFIVYSMMSALGFSVAYKICEQFNPIWPGLAQQPLLASVLGAVFVGVGAGLCVKMGGATGGDDALAMSIAHVTKINIQAVYLISDIIILVLSISYIPIQRIGYSLLTVILSGQIIGLIVKKRE